MKISVNGNLDITITDERKLMSTGDSVELLLYHARMTSDLRFAIRYHDAERAGKHLDLVIGDPNAEFVADFVLPKPTTIEELFGRKRLAIPQKPHITKIYLHSEIGEVHEITKGYGKGTWKIIMKGNAVKKEGSRSFLLYPDSLNRVFQFYRWEKNRWFLHERKKEKIRKKKIK